MEKSKQSGSDAPTDWGTINERAAGVFEQGSRVEKPVESKRDGSEPAIRASTDNGNSASSNSNISVKNVQSSNKVSKSPQFGEWWRGWFQARDTVSRDTNSVSSGAGSDPRQETKPFEELCDSTEDGDEESTEYVEGHLKNGDLYSANQGRRSRTWFSYTTKAAIADFGKYAVWSFVSVFTAFVCLSAVLPFVGYVTGCILFLPIFGASIFVGKVAKTLFMSLLRFGYNFGVYARTKIESWETRAWIRANKYLLIVVGIAVIYASYRAVRKFYDRTDKEHQEKFGEGVARTRSTCAWYAVRASLRDTILVITFFKAVGWIMNVNVEASYDDKTVGGKTQKIVAKTFDGLSKVVQSLKKRESPLKVVKAALALKNFQEYWSRREIKALVIFTVCVAVLLSIICVERKWGWKKLLNAVFRYFNVKVPDFLLETVLEVAKDGESSKQLESKKSIESTAVEIPESDKLYYGTLCKYYSKEMGIQDVSEELIAEVSARQKRRSQKNKRNHIDSPGNANEQEDKWEYCPDCGKLFKGTCRQCEFYEKIEDSMYDSYNRYQRESQMISKFEADIKENSERIGKSHEAILKELSVSHERIINELAKEKDVTKKLSDENRNLVAIVESLRLDTEKLVKTTRDEVLKEADNNSKRCQMKGGCENKAVLGKFLCIDHAKSVKQHRADKRAQKKKNRLTKPVEELKQELKKECIHISTCPQKMKTCAYEKCMTRCGGHNCVHFAGCKPGIPKKQPSKESQIKGSISVDTIRMQSCVIPITCKDGNGNAFLIGDKVVTAFHVADKKENVSQCKLMIGREEVELADAHKMDVEKDILIFKRPSKLSEVAERHKCRLITLQLADATVGPVHTTFWRWDKSQKMFGHTSSQGTIQDPSTGLHMASTLDGSSGSPLIQNGKCVGMHVAGGQGANVFVPASVIQSFLA